ncbi:hypothetical protein [Halarchaeum salinum]|uniref:Uncharacterized protein n=1 Tax=Halarchaeum salinum TaxID=489912 RepID=A0AAV3S8R4_9EURY
MPYKISMWIVLFLVFFNAGAGLLGASGAAAYLGVQPSPGGGEELASATSSTQDFRTGSGGGETLFALYSTLSGTLESIFNAIFPGAAMLKNAGVPDYLVTFLFTGLALIPGYDLIMFLRRG